MGNDIEETINYKNPTLAIAVGLNVDFDIAPEDSIGDIIDSTYYPILDCSKDSPLKINLFVTGKIINHHRI